MALSIRNKEVEALARRLAHETGESLTEAILHSLQDRLSRLRSARNEQDLVAQIMDVAARCGSLPDIDTRTADEILGYRQDGTVG
jgi:antitoxin VapB